MSKPAVALAAIVLLASLGGCGQKADKSPKALVTPQPILFHDITEGKLYGSGCNFVPSDGGMGAYALGLDKHAYIKIGGKVVTLDPDTTSARLPKNGWSRYTGGGYALTLSRAGAAADKQSGVLDMFDGRMELADKAGKVLYSANGNIQCKPM